ncbi:hypothetical protein [Pseudomonas sp. URMO17WK12:I11]|uniref:hypothetical protein n=1 Tax=Pseudomonas sp. URMO17WK12:I11 TaxID=1283291 RepID=UPI0011A9534D|nr:hypothetical protein [Pseudomonas sp. URMO17WK12:I11]
MKLSDLWPRAGAGKSATPVVSVTVTKRAGAEQPIASGKIPGPDTGPRGPIELPATLAQCEVLEETLCRDAIRLECQIGQAKGRAVSEGKYADPDWYHRAKAALKHINRDRQRLMVHMKALRTEARLKDQQVEDRLILDVIKEALPAEQFMGYVRIAAARKASEVLR